MDKLVRMRSAIIGAGTYEGEGGAKLVNPRSVETVWTWEPYDVHGEPHAVLGIRFRSGEIDYFEDTMDAFLGAVTAPGAYA